jgi:hypothetical protein
MAAIHDPEIKELFEYCVAWAREAIDNVLTYVPRPPAVAFNSLTEAAAVAACVAGETTAACIAHVVRGSARQ